jgi:hypothetical protein
VTLFTGVRYGHKGLLLQNDGVQQSLVDMALRSMDPESSEDLNDDNVGVRAQALAECARHRTVTAGLWGAFTWSARFSGGDVLVDEAAEPVVSTDRDGLRACRSWRWVPGFWRYEPERPVGPVGVAMVDELVENVLQVPAVGDQ